MVTACSSDTSGIALALSEERDTATRTFLSVAASAFAASPVEGAATIACFGVGSAAREYETGRAEVTETISPSPKDAPLAGLTLS